MGTKAEDAGYFVLAKVDKVTWLDANSVYQTVDFRNTVLLKEKYGDLDWKDTLTAIGRDHLASREINKQDVPMTIIFKSTALDFNGHTGLTLKVPPRTIHSNDRMLGTWRTLLSGDSKDVVNHITLNNHHCPLQRRQRAADDFAKAIRENTIATSSSSMTINLKAFEGIDAASLQDNNLSSKENFARGAERVRASMSHNLASGARTFNFVD